MKGGTIIVAGSVRHHVGSLMIAGTIIIGGNAGRELGNSMMGGTIYIRGSHEALCANLDKTQAAQTDVEALEQLLAKYRLNLNCREFAKISNRPSVIM